MAKVRGRRTRAWGAVPPLPRAPVSGSWRVSRNGASPKNGNPPESASTSPVMEPQFTTQKMGSQDGYQLVEVPFGVPGSKTRALNVARSLPKFPRFDCGDRQLRARPRTVAESPLARCPAWTRSTPPPRCPPCRRPRPASGACWSTAAPRPSPSRFENRNACPGDPRRSSLRLPGPSVRAVRWRLKAKPLRGATRP